MTEQNFADFSELDGCESVDGWDATESEFGEDDELVEFARENLRATEVEPAEGLEEALRESELERYAEAAQRMTVAALQRVHVRGRVHVDVVYGERPKVLQRLFMVNSYMQMTGLDDPVIYEKLKTGRVVTRLGAPTGMGKTTKFAGTLAKVCGLRVCLVTLDAILAKSALVRQKEAYGIRGSSRIWSRVRGAYLGSISYADFCGIVRSGGRNRFFQDFDVFVFDEPQVTSAPVWLAKQYFGTLAPDTCSLLLLSATVSTNKDNDVVAPRVGQFHKAPVTGGFEGLLRSGQLIEKFCVDRTLVLVPDHIRVAQVKSYYMEAGCDVQSLDEGSCYSDVNRVHSWLRNAEAVCPRIVVSSEHFGIGHNLPVAYMITSATRVAFVMDGKGGVSEVEVPLREVDVMQHMGRTGRGLASGSGGVIASTEVDKSSADLARSEALEAYLGLIAADIKPRHGLFEEVQKLMPRGLTRDVALEILSVALPPAMVVRYLGSDGRVAARFVKAMELFVQPDHRLIPSIDMDPVGYTSWSTESLGGYYGRSECANGPKVLVPFQSTRLLRVAMHTLYAVSMQWFSIARWRPDCDGYVSDDEMELFAREKVKSPVVAPRLVVNKEPLEESEPVSTEQWVFNVDPATLAKKKKRHAMSWVHDSRAEMTVTELKTRAEKGMSFGEVTSDVKRFVDDGEVARVQLSLPEGRVDVESPGGSVVVNLAESVFNALISGEAMSQGFFYDVLHAYKTVGEKFVKSTLFDNWSAPWISILRSFCEERNVGYLISKNMTTRMSCLLGEMYDRFRVEAIGVCTTSNLYKSKFGVIFGLGAPSTSKLASLIRKGKLPIAQSDRFIKRFLEIKDAHAEATLALERCGVFVPHIVTKQQRSLPVRRKRNVLPSVGEEVAEQETRFRVI